MTREEAIDILWGKRNLGKKTGEAIEIAIQSLEQEPILDKIRGEIEKKHARAKQMSSVLQMNAYTDCLQIIDKYREGSEDK